MSFDPLPDAEQVCIEWLQSRSAVTSIAGQRISTRMDDNPVYPCVIIQRTGGLPVVRQRLDAPRIQFSVYGDPIDYDAGEYDAQGLAQIVRAELHNMAGYSADLAYVTGVDDDLGLARLPDDSRDPTVPRYVGGVIAYIHPSVAIS